MGGGCRGVGVTGNELGAEGGRAVVEGLKHNSTLTALNLWGEFAPPSCGMCAGVGVYLVW